MRLSTNVLGMLVLSALVVWRPASAAALPQHEGHQPAPSRPAAAAPAPQPVPEKALGWEPIRCWRQVSAGAISVGETFTVVLTCAVFQDENAQVIPDESRLGVASIQMAPFEILGGTHPPDVHRGSRRFFQYDYQLRIIGPDAIGHDVNIPPLTISYRIHSRIGAAATLEGRDLSYLMPMMPIKVLSLVPADAADIRDASDASLAAVESLRFRTSLFRVLALAFGALAAVMAVLAVVPLARSKTKATTDERGQAPDRAVMATAAEDLADVQTRAASNGWNDDLIARALGSIRLISAVAIEQPIGQAPFTGGGPAPDGKLRIQPSAFRRSTVVVSSSVTADDVARARANGSRFSTTRQQQLVGLESALSEMTRALYRRDPARDSGAIGDGVRQAIGVANDIAAERSWWRTRWARR
ncbi:MAG TPA: hypothetical protein VF491_20635 [Vicinamibacterales bacterium]